jgi:hypothetical protein
MMSKSLWPNFSSVVSNRGMREMLTELAGDIGPQTNGDIEFHIDTLGVSGVIDNKIRHNCYLRVPKTNYNHLLFRVTTPVPGPWPATAATPEGDKYPEMEDETQLRNVIEQILNRDRTKEVVYYLLSTVR